MSELDDKLRVMLQRQTLPVVDDDITRIKELFIEEGWAKVDPVFDNIVLPWKPVITDDGMLDITPRES